MPRCCPALIASGSRPTSRWRGSGNSRPITCSRACCFGTRDGLFAGTQRLRIVDRDRAVQPWVSSDGRWLLCYNGEIFNYRQLRAELIGLGRDFRSESDTEVALEAFLTWGDRAVGRFRG